MRKKPAGADKRIKKKTSILTTEKVVWVDYKDANLLRRFMSDRAKIRAPVTGNDQQQQAAVAKAIKLSREMALLPYSVRSVQQRTKGRGRDRRGDSERDSELAPDAEVTLPRPEELEAAAAALDGAEAGNGVEAGEGADGNEPAGDSEGEAEVLADVSPGGETE